MVTGADGNAFLVGKCGDVVRMNVAQSKGHQAAAFLHVARTVNGDLGKFLQSVEGVLRDLLLVLANLFHADACQVINGDAKTDRFGDVGRAGLEFVRQIVVDGVVEPDFLDHFATTHERRHGFQERAFAVENAAGGRAAHLVAAEHEEVGVERLYVHAHVRNALRAIDEHQRALLVGGVSDLADGIDRAEDVGLLRDRDQLGAAGEKGVQVPKIQCALIGEFDAFDDGAGLFADLIPRHGVAVVFHPRQEDLVAFLEIGACPGVGDKIDGFGGAAGEDDAVGRGRVDEFGELLAGAFVLARGALGEGVDAAMDVRVVALVIIVQRLDDDARLLRGGGVVEINQRLAVDLLPQDRKVVTDFFQFNRIENFDHCLRTTLSWISLANSFCTASTWIRANTGSRNASIKTSRASSVVRSAAAQVKELLFFELADRRAVGAAELVRFDFQNRAGVAADFLAQHEIAIGLVGVGAVGVLFDFDHAGVIADGLVAQHILEKKVAGRVAGLVMLFGELAELLVVVEDADAVHETRAAFAFHDAFHVVALERRAEHAEHPVDLRVAGDVGAFEGEIVNVR